MLPLSCPDAGTSLKAPNNYKKMGKAKTYASSKTWKVDSIKAVAKTMDCTLNDVVMACLSGGMRKYLQSVSDPIVEKKKNLKIRALAVVNTRTGMEGLLEAFKKCEAPNEFSYVIPSMPLGDMSSEVRSPRSEATTARSDDSEERTRRVKINNMTLNRFASSFTLSPLLTRIPMLPCRIASRPAKKRWTG